jgi:uncharacterized membrane-anchored protein
MKNIHVPQVSRRYWLAITLASVFGTNLGDLYAHESGLGLWLGLAVLAVIVAIALLLERRDTRPHEGWYWFVILIIRTGATNIADFLAFRAHVPPILLGLGLIALLGALGWLTQRRMASAATVTGKQLPDTAAVYWAAMLTAGVLGTVLGDDASHFIGEGIASLVLGGALLAVLAATRARAKTVMAYWAIVGLARTAGTSIGDWVAENRTFAIGLPLASLLTGTVFVLLILLWPSRRPADETP